jgi:hypothetical protein
VTTWLIISIINYQNTGTSRIVREHPIMATAPHTISQHENHATPSTDDKITLQTSDYEEPNIEKGEVREVFQSNVDGVEFRTVSWQQACVLFVKFNFAMSILSIPGALAALGSVGGGLCIVGFTSLNTCVLRMSFCQYLKISR